jgi:tetraacyldisaccharide 4'-kinase
VMQVNALAEAAAADFVLTTEKDAGKLASLVTSSGVSWWALRIRADVVKGEEALRKVIYSPIAVSGAEVHA